MRTVGSLSSKSISRWRRSFRLSCCEGRARKTPICEIGVAHHVAEGTQWTLGEISHLFRVRFEGMEPSEQRPRFPSAVRRGDQESDRDAFAVFRLEFETETNEHQVGDRFDNPRASCRVLKEVECRQASRCKTRIQHAPDGRMTADGAQVPGEGQDVLPKTVFMEERY